MTALQYPPARLGDVVDDHHGELVADPYRWLEDAASDETRAWVTAENELTEAYLAAVPTREAIRAQLTDLWSVPRRGTPFQRGGRWFQLRTTGLQDQQVLYLMDLPGEEGRVLLDPNAFSADGTIAVTSLSVSTDGRLLAYATSAAGSDWRIWHVRDVEDGIDLNDVVEWSKYSEAAWLGDRSGFFYAAPERPEPGTELQAESRHLRILLHRLGSSQDEDEVVFSAPDEPEWVAHASVTFDGRYLVVSISRGTAPESQLHVLDLAEPGGQLRPLVGDFASVAEVVGNVGRRFFVLTEAGAERRRVVAIELGDEPIGPSSWAEVIPESDDTLVSVQQCGGRLVCHYLENAQSVLRVFTLRGSSVGVIPLPPMVSLVDGDPTGGVQGQPDGSLIQFKVASFLEPGTLWTYDLDTGESEEIWASPARLSPEEYVTEQVHAVSDDGTRIPLFLSHRRDVRPTGEVPVLLHGYGGFNIAITPAFDTAAAVWMQRGGVFAEAVLRGGGEFGTGWHDAGRLANKQNVFDDFCACAGYLCESGWSAPRRIAISGGSNGGLLVGACLTQHPEMFGAAVPEVGVLDMLRFHKFTIGWAWTSDFGDPEKPDEYPWPRAYSPLHHITAGRHFPPTLVMTGDHDDRVVPAHSYKFTATLQAAIAGVPGAGPALLRVETSAGHGAGKPTAKQIAERTDFLTFLEAALRLS